MSTAPTMMPGTLSRPPTTRIGNTLSPMITTPSPPPDVNVHSAPVKTEITPTIAHVRAT